MNVVVHGRHLEISEKFRDHVTEKLSKIERFGVEFTSIDVEVSHEANAREADREVEVELTTKGGPSVLRAHASAQDKYVAVDRAYARLEDQVRKVAERGHHSHKAHVGRPSA